MATKVPCAPRCKNFDALVLVGPRYGDKGRVAAQVRVRCRDCTINYRFTGLEPGNFSGMVPSTVSHLAYEAILPIEMMDPPDDAATDAKDPFDYEQEELEQRNAAPSVGQHKP